MPLDGSKRRRLGEEAATVEGKCTAVAMKDSTRAELADLRHQFLEQRLVPLPEHVWWDGMTEEDKMHTVPPLIEQYPRIGAAIAKLRRQHSKKHSSQNAGPDAEMTEFLLLRKLAYHLSSGVVAGEAAPSVDHILGATAGVEATQIGDGVIDLADSEQEKSFRPIDVDNYIMDCQSATRAMSKFDLRGPALVAVKNEVIQSSTPNREATAADAMSTDQGEVEVVKQVTAAERETIARQAAVPLDSDEPEQDWVRTWAPFPGEDWVAANVLSAPIAAQVDEAFFRDLGFRITLFHSPICYADAVDAHDHDLAFHSIEGPRLVCEFAKAKYRRERIAAEIAAQEQDPARATRAAAPDEHGRPAIVGLSGEHPEHPAELSYAQMAAGISPWRDREDGFVVTHEERQCAASAPKLIRFSCAKVPTAADVGAHFLMAYGPDLVASTRSRSSRYSWRDDMLRLHAIEGPRLLFERSSAEARRTLITAEIAAQERDGARAARSAAPDEHGQPAIVGSLMWLERYSSGTRAVRLIRRRGVQLSRGERIRSDRRRPAVSSSCAGARGIFIRGGVHAETSKGHGVALFHASPMEIQVLRRERYRESNRDRLL